MLNTAISSAGKIGLKSLDAKNRMVNMVSAGSKGKTINIAQMIACLGQQNVDGKRIPNSYNNRSLPPLPQIRCKPEAKGFVESSFIGGLKPQEFFFHAMGGREGLIDTAVKTSETGYIQRKLIKAMEDCKVVYDLSVRNASGSIIQFKYGEDGMDYAKVETQHSELLSSSFDKIQAKHQFSVNEDWDSFLGNAVIKDLKKTKNYMKKLDTYFGKLVSHMHFLRGHVFKENPLDTIKFPVNIFRLIKRVKEQFAINSTIVSNLNPLYIISRTEELIADISKNGMGNTIFNILLEEYLSPKVLCKFERLNKIAFDYIIENIKMEYNKSFVEVSEMVGPIAAQSIGEPATQMTLNTFHFAGVSSEIKCNSGCATSKRASSHLKVYKVAFNYNLSR